MKHLIDKDALVAEINKRMSRICGDDFYAEVKRGLYNSLIIYLNTHEVKEVDLEEIIKSHFGIKNINDVKITTSGKNLLNFAMRINKFVMNTAFELYRQIGENTGNESLDEEIEKTIKMNDMWGDLMPNTLIKYTAKHFFELGMAVSNKAQKGE